MGPITASGASSRLHMQGEMRKVSKRVERSNQRPLVFLCQVKKLKWKNTSCWDWQMVHLLPNQWVHILWVLELFQCPFHKPTFSTFYVNLAIYLICSNICCFHSIASHCKLITVDFFLWPLVTDIRHHNWHTGKLEKIHNTHISYHILHIHIYTYHLMFLFLCSTDAEFF